MNTEKTVRKQAKKVLEGNRSVIISEIMVTVLAFLTGLFAFSLAMSVAGLYDVKNPNQTQQLLTMILGLYFCFCCCVSAAHKRSLQKCV